MSNAINADVVVIGAGPGGYVCAIRLAQLGKKVTVVDKDVVGGVCLNRGCIPSKAFIHAGSLYKHMRDGAGLASMGLSCTGAALDMPKLVQWKDGVVKKLTGGIAQLFKAHGINHIVGEARFTSPKSLEVKTASETLALTFNQCVIATGSRPAMLPGVTADPERVLDSTGALSLKRVPKSMLCVGGGYIGLELGTFYNKIGTEVTVVEAFPTLLGSTDPELTKVVQRKLEKSGVKILLKTAVKEVKVTASGVDVTFADESGKSSTASYETMLVTIGRVPNSQNIGLEKAGITPDAKGFIPVDARRQTKTPNIYAIGDVAGQPLLAHKGSKEGIVAAEAIAGMKTVYDVVAMPAVIFTDPEIATVGLSEAEAKARGIDVMVGAFPYGANGKALSMNESEGLVKVIGDKKTGRLLGVHICGAEASALIAEAALAIEMGAQVEDLALTVHAHPTLPETMMEAAEAALGHAIHIFKPASRKA